MKKSVFAVLFLLFAVAVVSAQTECESMLEAANNYYDKGDYAKAAKMYQHIQENCDSNYGGAAAKLNDCNQKLMEEEDFEKSTSITACNYYLKKYPEGRYVDQVRLIRAELIKASVNVAKDDSIFNNCVSEEDFREYLKKNPYGRHIAQAKAMVAQFEEEKAYENCVTVSDCDAYLKAYPKGRHCSEVLEMKNAFEEERLRKEREAEKTAFMNIKKIDFANTQVDGNLIDAYGATIYVSEVQYLTPRISYDGLLDETRLISLFYKIFRPDGTLMYKSESPTGYSNFNIFTVQVGENNYYELPIWGGDKAGYYEAGTYRFELWFNGSRIYQTSFVIDDKATALSRGNWRTALKRCCDNVSNRFENGTAYKGQYYNYRRSGLGMHSYKGISFYIGDWSLGDRNGIGLEITPPGCTMKNCPDCEYFVGEYSSDKKSGTGACYDTYGNLIYIGGFSDNKPESMQNYPTTGYDSYKFECIEYLSGDYYVGETYNGKPNGKGLYIYGNGDLWYGDWKYGNRDGNGVYLMYDGSVMTGA